MTTLHILTTGGSIDKTYSTRVSDFVVGDPQAGRVLAEANVNLRYEITELARKDSLALTDDDRAAIVAAAQASPHRHIVITHGTDTMPQTAAALRVVTGKTIVITGAMQPAAFRETDAVFNLGAAVVAAQIMPPGVYIVMNGRVFDAHKAVKNHATNQYEDAP
jgi:L-asparaginase